MLKSLANNKINPTGDKPVSFCLQRGAPGGLFKSFPATGVAAIKDNCYSCNKLKLFKNCDMQIQSTRKLFDS